MNKVRTEIGGLVYTIWEDGSIEKRRGKGLLRCFPDKDGYLKVSISLTERTINAFLHRVVYEAFYGEIPEGMTVDHIDDDRLNNHHTNLQLLTPEENAVKGNARNWIVTDPSGEIFEVYNLTAFCKEQGIHAGHMYEVARGYKNQSQCKGWKCYEL